MDSNKDLERVIQDKVKPIIDTSMQKFLGISIKELSADISDRLKRTPLLDFKIDTSVPFKKAKQLFKEEYIKKLLQLKQGNISDVAKLANIDRRSIHRFAKNLKKEVQKFRKDLSSEYTKETTVKSIIDETLDQFKDVINPKRLEKFYKGASDLSKEILKELPTVELTLKEALTEFEKEFLKKALKENLNNISKTAKAVGLRAETLFRKIKKYR
ncbi:hypothetical protein J4209_06480 [Candidatus Woesearchaeota archaeon]|nr:hypothetical protein [Candidatus Woesearchaeota archaeon]